MYAIILYIIHFLTMLDLLFPNNPLRKEDWDSIPIAPYIALQRELTSMGLGSLDRLLSATRYHDSAILQRTISLYKYQKMFGLSNPLAMLIVQASLPYVHDDIMLVPVPLHFSRYVSRGFNQAVLLARRISAMTGLPMKRLLRRTKNTGHQAWRSRYERMESIRDSFALSYFVHTVPMHVVLIDDIATTGATLDACADVLKRSGVQRVDAWVIARA